MTEHVREDRPKESNAGLVLGGLALLCYAFTAFAGRDNSKIGADLVQECAPVAQEAKAGQPAACKK